MPKKKLRAEISRQRSSMTALELYMNGEVNENGISLSVSEEMTGGCRLGRIDLSIASDELEQSDNLQMQEPIRLYLPVDESPRDITAIYMFSSWWTRPAFVQKLSDIPDKTQVLLLRYDNRYACFVPMVGERFKAYLTCGNRTQLQLVLKALYGGISEVHEPLFLYAEALSVDEAISTVFTELARVKNIRLREQRRIPEMFRRLGWCSWNAFYTDVNDEGIRQKAAELAEKHVPVKWMIIDDGWLTLKNRLLYDYQPDREKFPEGFRGLIEDIRRSTGVEWFGVWHALMGYWSGICPDSPVARQEAAYLRRTASGRLVPDPDRGAGFYRDWYKTLTEQGISFVKVDGQGTIPLCFENTLPLGEAADALHGSLEDGASRMDSAIINCMGMSMENILSRPASAISRNSDDFFPTIEDSFKEHLLQNAYNSLYHDRLYCCDWDMFWTTHPDSVKHALLRAISGGPVYFSDRVGETDADVLRPLSYINGELLMMDRSAKPTADCVFIDPFKSGFIKLQNTASFGAELRGGGIAVYNLGDGEIACSVSPCEIDGISSFEKYLVYDYFSKTVRTVRCDEKIDCRLEKGGYGWFVFLPVTGNCTPVGLTDKYVGFTAIESIRNCGNIQTVILHEADTFAFVSDDLPKKITVNGGDVTDIAVRNDALIVIPMDEEIGQTVVVIEM